MCKIKSICRSIANNKFFGIGVFLLISLSIVMIFAEIALLPENAQDTWIQKFNDFIILLFLLELVIRLLAVGSFKDFIGEYWIDVIALLPMMPFLRVLRVFRLIRLLRMMSLLIFLRRHLRAVFYFFRKRILEYILIFSLVFFVVLIATLSLSYFEGGVATDPSKSLENLKLNFWITLYSMFSGEYITQFPDTVQGKVILLFVMFCGMGLFAILTGTVSAFMIERLKEGAILGKLNFRDMENHIIICGWNDHVPKIIAEFQSDQDYRNRNYLIIAEIDDLPDLSPFGVDMTSVYLIKRDFISSETLTFANIQTASVAVILADTNKNRTDHDADARTVLAALTIEKLNPGIYSCAELVHPENESHLAMSGIESIVLSSNISAYMMTQAAMKASVVPFYTELLRPSQGNQIYEVEFPKDQLGKKFEDVLEIWKKKYDSLLVGIMRTDGHVSVNPRKNDIISEQDKAIVIARKKPRTN